MTLAACVLTIDLIVALLPAVHYYKCATVPDKWFFFTNINWSNCKVMYFVMYCQSWAPTIKILIDNWFYTTQQPMSDNRHSTTDTRQPATANDRDDQQSTKTPNIRNTAKRNQQYRSTNSNDRQLTTKIRKQTLDSQQQTTMTDWQIERQRLYYILLYQFCIISYLSNIYCLMTVVIFILSRRRLNPTTKKPITFSRKGTLSVTSFNKTRTAPFLLT
jgi:hypothetical protein